MLKTNYFLGHGPKSFRVLCQKFQLNKLGCSTHPHNFYIQALAEIGLLGFFTLLIGFIYFVCKLFSKLKDLFLKKKITANIFLIIAVLIILFPFQPNGNLFGNWISIPTFLTIGLYLYDIKILSKKKEVSST
jgi:O-antigen ligase